MPVIESVASQLSDRARFVKVHVDEEGKVQEAFNASSLPSYLIFKDGKEVSRIRLTFLSWFLEGRVSRMVKGAL